MKPGVKGIAIYLFGLLLIGAGAYVVSRESAGFLGLVATWPIIIGIAIARAPKTLFGQPEARAIVGVLISLIGVWAAFVLVAPSVALATILLVALGEIIVCMR